MREAETSASVDGSVMTMPKTRRNLWLRAGLMGLASGLMLLFSGDKSAQTATPGIDPLEILKLQIKPNVLVILDTSGSMDEPFTNTPSLGGDDFSAKMHKGKKALNQVLIDKRTEVNFGLETYFTQNVNKTISTGNNVFRYVSDDPNANKWTGGTAAPDSTTDYFRATTTPYTGNTGSNVYHSFGPFTTLLDFNIGSTCTVEPCRRFLNSRLIRNNTKFTWDTTTIPPTNTTAALDAALTSTTAITCPLPPERLFPDDPDADADGLSDIPRACVQMQDSSGNVTTFWYDTALWRESGTSNCSGGFLVEAVSACNADNVPLIQQALKEELPIDGSCGNPVGIPCGITPVTTATTTPYTVVEGTNPATTAGLNPNTALGVIAAGSTPLGGSLNYVNTNFNTVFPNFLPGLQQNFVILITDGIETCGGNPTTAATNLYNHNPRVYTFVIGLAVSTGTLDSIARAGSGGTRDAFSVSNVDDLIAALNAILDTAVSTGSFSASNTVIGTVFELVTSPADPLDPATRYNQRVNILFQTTFGLPGWEGHVYAFRNDGTFLPAPGVNFTGNWDAGETLFEQVSQVMEVQNRGTGRQDNQYTFAELHNGATVSSISGQDPTSGGALIKRRIFTSNGNGSFLRDGTNDNQFDASTAAGRNVVALWPPNQTGLTSGVADIDPAVGTVGPLDDALGIGAGSSPVMTFAQLQTTLGACLGSADADSGPIPAACSDPALQLDTARKEAREILLAWIAGARLDRGTTDALPRRAIDVSGELLYRDRGWLLLDSENSTPAVVTPPFRTEPPQHGPEFFLFRDGRRSASGQGIAEIDKGFGLTNPDQDDTNPQSKPNLKPVMTVVYVGSNDMLHAFRAQTSEELWGYVPYDQLGKIMTMINPGQVREPHIYMVASSPKVVDLFIHDVDGYTVTTGLGAQSTFTGRWRVMLVFGRGAGGKFYTALDVTAPGPFTRAALDTNPPWVMWSRGNPDAADATNFAKMGQTWSIPALGDVSGTADDWRVFVGSGYGDTPDEGTTFYELAAESGNVLLAKDVADGTGTYIPDNALVGDPAAYNPFALRKDAADVDPEKVTRVYIGDIHGRLWTFNTVSGGQFADEGPTEPFGVGFALLKINAKPHVFTESGNDSRVPTGLNPPFKFFGYRDDGTDSPFTTLSVQLFGTPLTSTFRGTVSPVSAFNSAGKGRVFFAATRFNPPGSDCISSFDTILFAVGAESGNAVYDFTGDNVADLSTTITGTRTTGLQAVGAGISLGKSGSRTTPPTPTPPPVPTPTPPPPAPPKIVTLSTSPSSPVCRTQ